VAKYVPEAGDIVWLDFNPQAGREQSGHRPAVVLSPRSYNSKTGLMLCCPMTTRVKGYPFEVQVAGGQASVVLSDQVKSLDFSLRKARYKDRVSMQELSEIRAKAIALIGSPRI
jgi:mRNA interferase MazF